jgi:hypothetical protein
MKPCLIAIDPGASGGLAIQHGSRVEIHKMPETPKDICDLLLAAQTEALAGAFSPEGGNGRIKCYIEEVSGFAGVGQPGSAMFNFGRGFGNIEGMLVALQIPFELVRPQKWMKALALGTSGVVRATPGMTVEDRKSLATANARRKTEWKNKLKEHAQRLYPHLKITLATSDALLLLEYARRQEQISAPQPPQGQLI